MSESYIQVPPDSTGKKVRTLELTVGSNNVHQEVHTIADESGNIVVGNVADSQNFTDPSSNPSLSLDLKGRKIAEVYVKSIGTGKTVNIYGSIDNTNWRRTHTAKTDSNGEYSEGFWVAYRYMKVELEETGTGTATIEITAV